MVTGEAAETTKWQVLQVIPMGCGNGRGRMMAIVLVEAVVATLIPQGNNIWIHIIVVAGINPESFEHMRQTINLGKLVILPCT